MHTKLIISSFACLFGLQVMSQNLSSSTFNDQDLEISVYPNPAVEYLMVQLDQDVNNAYFELTSMIGNKLLIRPESAGNGKYKIPVKQLATGYYFLIVKSDEQRFKKAKKFLKL